MKKEYEFIAACLIALSIFSFLGWYTAEVDNELLRAELSQLKNEEIRR